MRNQKVKINKNREEEIINQIQAFMKELSSSSITPIPVKVSDCELCDEPITAMKRLQDPIILPNLSITSAPNIYSDIFEYYGNDHFIQEQKDLSRSEKNGAYVANSFRKAIFKNRVEHMLNIVIDKIVNAMIKDTPIAFNAHIFNKQIRQYPYYQITEIDHYLKSTRDLNNFSVDSMCMMDCVFSIITLLRNNLILNNNYYNEKVNTVIELTDEQIIESTKYIDEICKEVSRGLILMLDEIKYEVDEIFSHYIPKNEYCYDEE